MFYPKYIVKYIVNRDTKEFETRIFDSTVKTQPDKFGNVDTDTTKPCSVPYDSFQSAQYACHVMNLNHQQGYSGSDFCQVMEKHLGYPLSDHHLPEAIVEAIDHYGYEISQVDNGKWLIEKGA